jgi:hypothetical protein
MNRRYCYPLLAGLLLAGCNGQDPEPPSRTLGGQVGDSYKQMLDETGQTVQQLNQQMQDSDQRMQELRQ